MGTGEAASIIGRDPRTIERWVDGGQLRGGRPPLPNSHRWVDAEHVVLYALAGGRAHLIPDQWRFLIPRVSVTVPTQPTGT